MRIFYTFPRDGVRSMHIDCDCGSGLVREEDLTKQGEMITNAKRLVIEAAIEMLETEDPCAGCGAREDTAEYCCAKHKNDYCAIYNLKRAVKELKASEGNKNE